MHPQKWLICSSLENKEAVETVKVLAKKTHVSLFGRSTKWIVFSFDMQSH